MPFIIPVGDPANGNNFDQCPDADVVMSYSATDKAGNPLGWSPVPPVNTEAHDQIMPSLQVDHRTNIVHIAYYSSQWDPQGELVWLVENQIQSNSYAAGPIRRLTTAPLDQSVDFANGNGDFVDLGVGVCVRSDRNAQGYPNPSATSHSRPIHLEVRNSAAVKRNPQSSFAFAGEQKYYTLRLGDTGALESVSSSHVDTVTAN